MNCCCKELSEELTSKGWTALVAHFDACQEKEPAMDQYVWVGSELSGKLALSSCPMLRKRVFNPISGPFDASVLLCEGSTVDISSRAPRFISEGTSADVYSSHVLFNVMEGLLFKKGSLIKRVRDVTCNMLIDAAGKRKYVPLCLLYRFIRLCMALPAGKPNNPVATAQRFASELAAFPANHVAVEHKSKKRDRPEEDDVEWCGSIKKERMTD